MRPCRCFVPRRLSRTRRFPCLALRHGAGRCVRPPWSLPPPAAPGAPRAAQAPLSHRNLCHWGNFFDTETVPLWDAFQGWIWSNFDKGSPCSPGPCGLRCLAKAGLPRFSPRSLAAALPATGWAAPHGRRFYSPAIRGLPPSCSPAPPSGPARLAEPHPKFDEAWGPANPESPTLAAAPRPAARLPVKPARGTPRPPGAGDCWGPWGAAWSRGLLPGPAGCWRGARALLRSRESRRGEALLLPRVPVSVPSKGPLLDY